MHRGDLQRLHVEQPVRCGRGVRRGGLRSVHCEQSMRTERSMHRDPHAVPLHVLDEQRLRFRRSMRLGYLHTRLQLERRLRNRSGMRRGSLWRLHVGRTVRQRIVDELPERNLHVLSESRLPDRIELRQRNLRHVPIEFRLWRASMQSGCLQSVFDVQRLQPDQS